MFKSVKTVGIVGYGAFGSFSVELLQRFLPMVTIKVYSRRFAPDGELFASLEEVAGCDIVVLCTPIREYEETLLAILPHVAEKTVLVDVATVKGYTNELFLKHAKGHRFVSAHPMFGVESYKKKAGDVSGFRIVLTDYTLANDDYLLIKNMFSVAGFVVVEMSSDEHDKLLAESLFLTHYVGQSIERAGFSRTAIDTVSFSYLMDAVESVSNDGALFEDVYRYNPYCKKVAERFHTAQDAVLQQVQQ